MSYVLSHMYHVTHDMTGVVNIPSKFQVTNFYGLVVEVF